MDSRRPCKEEGTPLNPTPQKILSYDARQQFSKLLDNVEHHGAHVVISRYVTPAGVLIPYDWYQAALAVTGAVARFAKDENGNWLAKDTSLTVGDLMQAIGEAAISQMETHGGTAPPEPATRETAAVRSAS